MKILLCEDNAVDREEARACIAAAAGNPEPERRKKFHEYQFSQIEGN